MLRHDLLTRIQSAVPDTAMACSCLRSTLCGINCSSSGFRFVGG